MTRRLDSTDRMPHLLRLAACALLVVLALLMSAPPTAADTADAEVRGEYLVQLLGCGRCHTEGALTGEPTGPWLAGSRIGIGWTHAHPDEQPGVVFPSNLTPDEATGLGSWSEGDIVRVLTSGVDHAGGVVSRVMPWAAYGMLHPADAAAIASYLKQLPPLHREIPEAVLRGQPGNHPYVRFSVHTFEGTGHGQDKPLPLPLR